MLDSVLQKEKCCFVCGAMQGLECHHIYGGIANRPISEKLGLKVWLCVEHHRGTDGVHGKNGKILMEHLHKKGQEYFEEHYGNRMDFIKSFGKSYL